MKSSARQLGRTTRAMQAAPHGAIYVWCNERLAYPRALARRLSRSDLQIVGPSWLTNYKWRGVHVTGVVLDHACHLAEWCERQAQAIRAAH